MKPEELLLEAASTLENIGPIVSVPGGLVVVVGDTHGYPEVTEWALAEAERIGADHIVFLGDYVDRGPRGVENLEMLAERLLQGGKPSLVLLRGNHEDPEMNLHYGFAREAHRKRGPDYLEAVERLYTCLPLAAETPAALLLHGGVPCRRCSSSPEEPISLGSIAERLAALRCSPRLRDTYSEPLARHLLWNDPRGGLEWFSPSPRGPGIYLYGRLAWRRFLEKNNAAVLIRAHEVVDALHIWLPDGSQEHGLPSGWETRIDEVKGSVITVFSSLYHGAGAGLLLLDTEESRLRLLRYPG